MRGLRTLPIVALAFLSACGKGEKDAPATRGEKPDDGTAAASENGSMQSVGTPAAKAEGAKATQTVPPTKAVPAAPDEYVLDAPADLAKGFHAAMSASALWKVYFEARGKEGAPRPWVRCTATWERKLDPPSQMMPSGAYKLGKVTLTLKVFDAADKSPLFEATREERLPSVIHTRIKPQEAAFQVAEKKALEEALGAAALGALAARPALNGLLHAQALALLNDLKQSTGLRAEAALRLGEVQPLAAATLERLAHFACVELDTNREVSAACGKALASQPPDAIEPLGRILAGQEQWTARKSAAELLGRLGAPAVPALLKGLTWKDAATQAAVFKALEELGPQAGEAAPALLAIVRTDLEPARGSAARVLPKLGATASAPLTEALRKEWQASAQDRKRESVCGLLINALRNLGAEAKPALPLLNEIAQGKSRYLASQAAKAAQEIEGK